MTTRWRPWRQAMQEALYGDRGFFRRTGAPARHFRTSPVASQLYAAAVVELARRVDVALGEPPDFTLVDVGAGGGELLDAVATAAPTRWRLLGVEVVPRPAALPEPVEWVTAVPAGVTGLVVANEWLDNVPVDVVELADDGLRLVEVDDTGEERLGAPPEAADVAWVERWWPLTEPGTRAEVGRSRDAAWTSVVTSLGRGVAVAVDYSADPAAHPFGTLTGYRDGRQVVPVPDGSCDVTAHVMLRACAAAGTGTGATGTLLTTQRAALRELGLSGARPAYGGDPAAYLSALSRAGEAGELLDPGGLGGFGWLVQAKGTEVPFDPAASADSS